MDDQTINNGSISRRDGDAFYYFMLHLSSRRGLNKSLAVLMSLICYIISLWLGIVLGLNGTMWN
jgi:hypothetical protein